jgi:hypothetical protein
MEVITQTEAKARGLTSYTGVPCKRGHTQRYTNSRGCVECARTRVAASKTPKQPKPIKPGPAAEAAPAAYEPERTLYKDPGQRISQARIDACIDRIYGSGPRLGAAAVAESEAA